MRATAITQIRWGIADYQNSFGAKPEGMWLPETAADTATLEALAANGIKFTVLAPHQCKRIRPLEEATAATWTDTPERQRSTPRIRIWSASRPAHRSPFSSTTAPISRAIAFEGLLDSGDNFVARLKAGFKDGAQPQLVHVATDGESYGHHHKYGEMALAYALRLLEQDKTVKLTNYASFLEQFPPEFECEIVDEHFMELRARHRALALQLRLQRRHARLEPGLARAAAPGPRRAARRADPAHRAGGRQALQRCLGRARRLHPGGARPQHGVGGSLLRRAAGALAHRN